MNSLTRFPRSVESLDQSWAAYLPVPSTVSPASTVPRHFLPHMCTSVLGSVHTKGNSAFPR